MNTDISDILAQVTPPTDFSPATGGLQFKDVAPLVCGVVDNGVCSDDPRVLVRVNEATKIILDQMIPVGGMITALVTAFETFLVLPPQMENCIEAYPSSTDTSVRGDTDITQGWYEIMNDSVYLDPSQHHDNPLVDRGLYPSASDPSVLQRVYVFPGLQPPDSVVVVTGKRRFIPVVNDEDYVIVQNVEALKLVILSIERNENNAPDDALKYRQQAFEMLQSEVKQHLLDPRNYMRRKSQYQDESVSFRENTMGWMRANIALDVEEALKTGRMDLIWSINQMERRIMQSGKIYKDMVFQVQANVQGGIVYFPIGVGGVLAVDLCGQPIPMRSQFFPYLENGPGMFAFSNMMIDQGDEMVSGSYRRKYKLIADCQDGQTINAICMARWTMKKPDDMMTIKNYEAIRLMMNAKFREEKEDWQVAAANQAQAFKILDDELQTYLSGIRHTVHVQTYGFGLGDVSNYWTL
jgi:hypothetical protein